MNYINPKPTTTSLTLAYIRTAQQAIVKCEPEAFKNAFNELCTLALHDKAAVQKGFAATLLSLKQAKQNSYATENVDNELRFTYQLELEVNQSTQGTLGLIPANAILPT